MNAHPTLAKSVDQGLVQRSKVELRQTKMTFNGVTCSKLIGRNVMISVGEPWDFSSPDGDNRLIGRISCIFQHASGHDVIVVDTTQFSWDGLLVGQLFCSRRYSKGIFLREFFEDGRFDCNLYFCALGGAAAEEEMPNLPLGHAEWANSLIGTLTVLD